MISDTTIEVSVFVETGAAGHALPVLQQLHLEGVDLKVISSGETDRFEKARAVLFFLAHVPDMNPTAAGRTTAETLFEGLSASGIPVMALIPDPATAPSSEEWQRIQKNLAIVDLQNAFIARLREDTLCRVANLTDAEQHSAEVCAAVETLSMLVKSQESLTEDHTYVANPPRLHTPYRYPLHNNVFVGREADQQALTAWAAESEQPVYALIAMGGSGKSALAWNWLQEGAMTVTEPFEGYFWWDFYHDSDCEKCIAQLLTYLSGGSYGLLLKRSLQKNLEELQSHLNGRRILICLDGVERILNHYREFDADAHDALGAEDDDTGVDVWYRACARQEGTFLQALTGMHLSKALLTSRLLPVDLEVDGEVHPGVHVSDRLQMLPDDVLALMHRLEVKASEKVVDKISGLVGGHPLALRALAGAVKSDHRGDLDSWFAENGEFDVASLDLVGRRSHILRHAMMGIGARSLALLGAAAAFRGPASLDDLVSVLLTGGDLLTSDREVQAGLKDLKDRQLLFLDEANGQVDMHPLVRGVVWKGLDQTWKEILAEQHGRYFQNLTRDLDLSTSASFNALRHHWFSLIERRRRDEAVKAITPSVHEHIVTHGRAVDVSLMFEALLESAESLSEPVTNDIDRRWEFHYWYSFALSYSGRPASAAEQMVEALAVAGHAGDADGERSQDQKASIVVELAGMCRNIGLHSLAANLCNKARIRAGAFHDRESKKGIQDLLTWDMSPSDLADLSIREVAENHQWNDTSSWTFYRLSLGLGLAERWLDTEVGEEKKREALDLAKNVQLLAVRNGLRELEIRARGVVALANLQLGGGETLLLHVIDSALEEARRRRLIASEAILLCCRLRCAEQLGKADVNTVRHAHSAGHYNQKLENAAALAKLNVAVAKVFQIAGKQDLAAESARRALALSLQPDGNCAFAITAGKSQQILSEVGATSDNLVIPVHISQRIQTLCDRIESSSFLS